MDNSLHFLRYSLDKGRKIVLIYMDKGKVIRTNATVLGISDASIRVQIRKKEREIPGEALLGAGYARGDSGDLEDG